MTRNATLNDIDRLSILFDSYRVFYGKLSDINAAKQFLSERLTKNESIIFVSETPEGHLTGFVQLYPLFSSTRLKRLWLLNDLFVHPDFRSQGYSIALIDKAKELAISSKSEGLILETDKTNMIGNNLYPKTGFIVDDDHNYYSWSE